jgi:hypothetical protein
MVPSTGCESQCSQSYGLVLMAAIFFPKPQPYLDIHISRVMRATTRLHVHIFSMLSQLPHATLLEANGSVGSWPHMEKYGGLGVHVARDTTLGAGDHLG